MVSYAPLEIKAFTKKPLSEGAETRYWKRYRNVMLRQDHAPVTHISFSSEFYCTTSGPRVRFFKYDNSNPFSFSRFKSIATCGTLRQDGELFAAGEHEGKVQVMQVSRKTLLRHYKHPQAVHALNFTQDNVHLYTGCDDRAFRLFDLSRKHPILTYQEAHKDYLRAVGETSNGLFVTGGQDNIVKLWDNKSGEVLRLNHEAPISCLTQIGDYELLTTGHNRMRIWDLRNGKPVYSFAPHAKNITDVILDSSRSKLISVSLDQHLKVFDLTGYTLLHDIKYPAPILSAALTHDNTHLIVGMSDGKLSVRQHKSKSVAGVSRIDEVDKLYLDKWKKLAETLPKKLIKNYRYFYRGQYSKLQENEIKLEQEVQRKLKDYDKLLKKFRYWEVLKLAFDMERPEIIVSVIEELAQRNALGESLKNRSPVIFM